MNIELTDADVRVRLTDLEDNFVERKTEGDSSDWLKTVIAFANSTPVGYPAIMFIGVRNNGEVQGLSNPDSTQKSLSTKLQQSFPVPYYATRVLDADGKKYIAVIVPGSELRPHFAGQAYIRAGSQTVASSEDQFARLIAQRNSAAYELSKWVGKTISVWHPQKTGVGYHPSNGYSGEFVIVGYNNFYVTVGSGSGMQSMQMSFSYEAFDIGFDHKRNRLEMRFKAPSG
jgi:hypothetical protein